MESIKGIASLLVILSILVLVHEWGHYIAAKLCGMRVEDFSLFFGKVLVRLGVRHGTEYNIRSIPLGGFVRIAGMDDISGGKPILEAIRDPLFNDTESMAKALSVIESDTANGIDTSKISDEVRKAIQYAIGVDNKLTDSGLEDLQALKRSPRISTDEHKLIDIVLNAHSSATDPTLYSQKPIWQRSLVIFAGPFMSIFFGYLLFCIMGFTIGLPGSDTTNQILFTPKKDTPAFAAGLKSGDRIEAISGVPTPTGKELRARLMASAGVPLEMEVRRGGQTFSVHVTPTATDEPVEGKKTTHKVGRIGIVLSQTYEHLTPVQSVIAGTKGTYFYVKMLGKTIFGGKAREGLGGPIAMTQMTTAAQKFGFAGLFELTATFSLGLGIMNLLPIPILDGGHLLLLAVEKIRRRKLSPLEVYRAQMVGLGLLGMLVVFVTYNDIMRWITGRSIQ